MQLNVFSKISIYIFKNGKKTQQNFRNEFKHFVSGKNKMIVFVFKYLKDI